MNYENVTLCKLAFASTMYDSLTPFNRSLGRLNKDTGGKMDLANPTHRASLVEWLNDWGCRHLSEDQHEVASSSILGWYRNMVPACRQIRRHSGISGMMKLKWPLVHMALSRTREGLGVFVLERNERFISARLQRQRFFSPSDPRRSCPGMKPCELASSAMAVRDRIPGT